LKLAVHAEDAAEDDVARIIEALGPGARPVVITYLDGALRISQLCRTVGARIVQLHGEIGRGEIERLRGLDPGLSLVKSLIVGSRESKALESAARELSPLVDAFLTDSYDPRTGAAGATGRVHDWELSRRLVEVSERPVILAGGLTPDNVARAIRQVRPAGVDSHTGVEDATGRKSREKVARFAAEARAEFARLSSKGRRG
jgi:phosphoribosylanthranilate isomerase